MVTLAEFLQHVLVSAAIMAVGLAAVAFSRFRYDTAHKTLRLFTWWFAGLLIVIALMSWGSDVNNVRCPDEPQNTCRFNDMVPAIGTIAVGYALAGLWRGRSMYIRR